MDLTKITNIDTVRLIENATELFQLKKYRSKEYVKSFIGLGIHRSSFYGTREGDTVASLKPTETIFNSSQDIVLAIEGVVILTKEPVNNGPGGIVYEGYGILEVDSVVVYDGRIGNSLDGLEDASETLAHFKYNPITDKLEADRAIETTLNSLFLGEQHKMSSGAENIFFTNLSNNTNFYPM